MSNHRQFFSCYIIGEESLTIQCADLVLKNGYQLLGIISRHNLVKEWAIKHQTTYIDAESDFGKILVKKKFDYFFSIVNPHIIPAYLLKVPKRFAINYHDALLPQYAGVHATSWAILNKEKQHGITWHVMTDVVDAGDILKQAVIPIAADETALSLNLKCYEAAISTFEKLIIELATQTYTYTKQDLAQRTYYGVNQKPEGNGWINWHNTAQDIECLYRALKLGDYVNRLATLKFSIENRIYIVDELKILKKKSILSPGTITKLTTKKLQVATQTHDVVITKIKTLVGKSCDIQTLIKQHALKQGLRLTSPSNKRSAQYQNFSAEIFKSEYFWLQEIQRATITKLPFLKVESQEQNDPSTCVQTFTLSQKLQNKLNKLFPKTEHLESVLLAACLIYLYRINNQQEVVSVALNYPALTERVGNLQALTANYILCNLQFFDKINFGKALEIIKRQFNTYHQKLTYLKDIYARYPVLHDVNNVTNMGVILNDSLQKRKNRKLTYPVTFSINKKVISIYVCKSVLNANLCAALANIPGHLQTLLEDVANNSQKKISHLSLLTEKERQQTLIDWNKTQTDYPKVKTVHQLFEEQVAKTPENVAVVFEDQKLTYRELNEKANQLAYYLEKQGAKPGTFIAICVQEGLETIIGILAILKIGAAYIPIVPSYPLERIKHILLDSQAEFILVQRRVKKLFSKNLVNFKSILFFKKTIYKHNQGQNFTNSKIKSNWKCALIYTSGSTGLPKGVTVLHKNIVKLVKNINYIDIESTDCIAQVSNIAFDATHFEIWGALLNGAKLVIIPKTTLLSTSNFTTIIKTNHVSILWLTSSLFNQIYQQDAKTLYAIDKLIIGGEKLDVKLVKQFISARKNKPYVFLNGYGPTEATTFSACYKIDNKVLDLSAIPIGKPISNTQCYVVDKFLQPVPVGSIGELLIGGEGITAGYLNQLEQTKQKFIPNLFSKSFASKLYRTGDLVRWLPDGNLEYIGRTDNQIKLRGFRIELGEIEANLVQHPQILTAVVCLRLIDERKQLEAFYIQKKQDHKTLLNAQSLERYLKSKLPDYMVPKVFMEVKDFPLTLNGKIDKNKLLALAATTVSIQQSDTQQENLSKSELELIHIWRKILKLANISAHDNFFALGGDSITAMSAVAEASKLGLQLTVQDIFKYPTIERLAKQVKQANTNVIKTILEEKPFTLTPIQQWFFEQSFAKQESFSQVCLLTLNEIADVGKLKDCLQKIIANHDAFRLHFQKIHSKWQQSYSNGNIVDDFVKVLDVSSYTPETLAENVAQYTYELQANFDLSCGPLVKAIIFTHCDSNTTKLLIAIHHLIIDGVSWRILLNELQLLYKSKTEVNKKTLYKPLLQSSSFHSWTCVLSNYVNSKKLLSQKNYWEKIDRQRFTMPMDYSQMGTLEWHSAFLQMQLTVEETKLLLQKIHAVYGIKVHELLTALLAKSLATWANTNQVVFDLESHGRAEISKELGFANTIGWFTSLFPVHLTVDIQASLRDLVTSIKQQLQKIPDYGIGYGLLRYFKKANLTQKRQVVFNYWGQFDQWIAKDGFQFEDLKLVSHPENKRTHLLNIDAVVKNQQLVFTWTYCKNAYHEKTLYDLAQQYLNDLRILLLTLNGDDANDLLQEFDYSLTKLSLEEIKTHLDDTSHIQKIYPLAPLQKGLLFHAVYSLTSEAYMVQLVWKAVSEINLDINCLQQAWQMLTERHDVLRTQFLWEGLVEPIQVVKHSVSVPWSVYDWSTQIGQTKQIERLNLFLQADRQAGFNFKAAPLLRITLIKLPENEFFVIATFHHILLDGWSLPILLSELNNLYNHVKNGIPTTLLKSKPYSDYIQWSQQQDLVTAEKFWREYLKGFAAPTDLAITHPNAESHAAGKTPEFAIAHLALPKKFVKQIKQFCRKNNITINTLFQGVWALLLNRYSHSEDIVFGITLAGRSHELTGSEQAVGLFINTLPLRVNFEQALTVQRYLAELQVNAAQLAHYQHVPLMSIQGWSDVTNSTQLFNSILVFENYPAIDNKDGLFKFSEMEIIDPTHYPLSCVVVPKDIFNIKISYDKKIIHEVAIKRLIGHLEMLLNEMVKFPEKKIHQLELLTAAERQQILIDWNNTEVEFPSDKTIHQLFEEQVERTPNNIAVVFENETLTYRELNTKANQLAHYLIKRGVKPESLVAICIERSLEMIIGILGILKAGGAYVPIDPEYPPERIKYVIQDSNPVVFLTRNNIWKDLKLNLAEKQHLAFFETDLSLFNNTNTTTKVLPHGAIYVIYTSGSTGKPKGVVNTHVGITNRLTWMQKTYQLNETDAILHKTSFSFDVSVWELLWPLMCGAKLVIAQPGGHRDAEYLKKKIIAEKITTLHFVPSMLTEFLKLRDLNKCTLVKRVICSGESLNFTQVENFFEKLPQAKLFNLYGPTEAAIDVTAWDCSIKIHQKIVPIGKPIANVKIYVLDKYLNPVPIGIKGELFIGGIGIAKYYLNNKHLTDEKFLNVSFEANSKIKLYRTGDLVRWLPDGNLEFLSRIDDQIKINGLRIELGEIQAQLDCYPDIQQSVIICLEKPNNVKQLVAYILSRKNIKVDIKSIRNFLLKFLPPYMVPYNFIKLDKFPLTSNGKIDKSSLPNPMENYQSHEFFINPRNENEILLAQIWKEVLGLKEIGINDDFFVLGGNSLLALSLLSKIYECYRVSLSVRELFEHPTVAKLTNIIDLAKLEKNVLSVLTNENLLLENCLIPLKPHGKKTPLFLIHPIGGTVFWYVSLVKYLEPDRPLYGIQDPGIELENIPFTSLEEMASFYIKAIKIVQPSGPYLIGGASAGANISVEIAHQLIKGNDKVAFVGLLDGWVPFPDMLMRKEFFEANMQRQFNTMLEKFVLKGIFRSEALLKLQWYRLQMYAKYQTPNIDFNLTLFKAANTVEIYKSVENKFNHWEHYTSQPIKRYLISGDHETIFQEPNIAILGRLLNECLETAEVLEVKIEECTE